jgi:hypothetical protein
MISYSNSLLSLSLPLLDSLRREGVLLHAQPDPHLALNRSRRFEMLVPQKRLVKQQQHELSLELGKRSYQQNLHFRGAAGQRGGEGRVRVRRYFREGLAGSRFQDRRIGGSLLRALVGGLAGWWEACFWGWCGDCGC